MRSLATICAATAAMTIASQGCSRLCNSEELSRVASVDRQLEAVVVRRNCGAATAERTAVVIVPRGDGVSGTRAGDVFRVKGVFSVTADWSGDTLVVAHGPGVPIEQSAQRSRGRPIKMVLRP